MAYNSLNRHINITHSASPSPSRSSSFLPSPFSLYFLIRVKAFFSLSSSQIPPFAEPSVIYSLNPLSLRGTTCKLEPAFLQYLKEPRQGFTCSPFYSGTSLDQHTLSGASFNIESLPFLLVSRLAIWKEVATAILLIVGVSPLWWLPHLMLHRTCHELPLPTTRLNLLILTRSTPSSAMKKGIVFGLGGLVGLCAAQEIPGLADLPECGQFCINAMQGSTIAEQLGCNQGDLGCLCRQQDFIYGVRDCSFQSCFGEGEADSVLSFGYSLCASEPT
ncbi:hypothetical protein SODALDRAFT_40679 [Sodiomyces alkalinus F11]|uniref:CFEM domain-containing protein n=1 Tax=Sodiomyces alkalinus (strain CBS 110278 / VKM F-3762 / F11) TaxID=1314773 RepID=A0A3N2QA11_SODAK|nr:hypothetical protein SODALDRAFT_40679 [Sodiomyces alkalinus F11]ROT43498.1 hypothetical protein SODALDRAFT_40679 [Sodiomyces alkalinus F11]